MRTFVIAVALIALALPASAQVMEIYELNDVPGRPFDPAWPPDGPGTTWHQMLPADMFCTSAEQTGHNDADGNGLIDACESIQLGSVWRHIEWVGPTYTLARADDTRVTIYVEYYDTARQNHYHVISPPEFECSIITTDQPLVGECQYVVIEQPYELQGDWHVERVGTNIHTGPGSPVEASTWGKMKAFFGGLID